ncbi:hypothetical protein [Gracilinema caldarium]|uniref:hypothetical protein n=1 Tax=Gracilinema caldarium TaxID=215591 RepID=UPI0026EB648D|nr:hypothetical protein [Gracilinema caldarium]
MGSAVLYLIPLGYSPSIALNRLDLRYCTTFPSIICYVLPHIKGLCGIVTFTSIIRYVLPHIDGPCGILTPELFSKRREF